MIVHNITFCVDKSIVNEFLLWVREVYVPRAMDAGFRHRMLCRVMGSPDPGLESYALHLEADGLALIKSWTRGASVQLAAEAAAMWGERVLLFATNLQVL